MKKVICSDKVGKAVGPYSQAIEANGFVYVSGQLPFDKDGNKEEAVEKQTAQSLENMKAILEEAGLSMDNIVKTTVLLQNMADFGKMNEVYVTYFSGDYPARVCYEVARLPKDVLVEIDCIATK